MQKKTKYAITVIIAVILMLWTFLDPKVSLWGKWTADIDYMDLKNTDYDTIEEFERKNYISFGLFGDYVNVDDGDSDNGYYHIENGMLIISEKIGGSYSDSDDRYSTSSTYFQVANGRLHTFSSWANYYDDYHDNEDFDEEGMKRIGVAPSLFIRLGIIIAAVVAIIVIKRTPEYEYPGDDGYGDAPTPPSTHGGSSRLRSTARPSIDTPTYVPPTPSAPSHGPSVTSYPPPAYPSHDYSPGALDGAISGYPTDHR